MSRGKKDNSCRVKSLTKRNKRPYFCMFAGVLIMTLADTIATISMPGHCEKQFMNIGEALKQTLVKAKYEDRITAGVYSSVKILQISPEMVMLCLIMDARPTEDVFIHIQHTLIEAYCLEQDIHLLRVSNLDKGAEALDLPETESRNVKCDYSCVLVQYPPIRTALDDFISDYCDKSLLSEDVFCRPVIDLPV